MLDGLHRYHWRKSPPYPAGASGPFEGFRVTTQPQTRADFLLTLARWNANPHGWHYEPAPVEAAPVPQYADYHGQGAPFPHYNAARDGWTVKALADLLSGYAREHGDAIVRFTSCGSGGAWPAGRGAMGVFTDHQAAVVDGSRVGEGVTFSIALIPFDKAKG